MTDRFTFPLSDAGFAHALQFAATRHEFGSHVVIRVEPIGMGQHALVVCVTPRLVPSKVEEHYRYGNMTALHLECGHVVYIKRDKRKPETFNCTVCARLAKPALEGTLRD